MPEIPVGIVVEIHPGAGDIISTLNRSPGLRVGAKSILSSPLSAQALPSRDVL